MTTRIPTSRGAAGAADDSRFRSLIENSNDVISLVDRTGTILYSSPSVYRVLGHEPDQRLGHSILDDLHPDDRPRLEKAFKRLVTEPGSIIHEIARHQHRDGHWLWMEGIAKNLLEDPVVRAIVVNYRDVTQRRQAEDKLAENEQRLNVLMDNLPGMVYRCANDPDWTLEFVSSGCLDLTGYTPADFLSGRIQYNDIIHADDRERVWNEVQNCVNRQQRFRIEYRINTKSAAETWVWEQGCGILDDDNEVIALEGFIADISTRKQTEQKLHESERFANATIDGLSAHIAIVDATGAILRVNRTWREFARHNARDISRLCEGSNYLEACDRAVDEDGTSALFAAGIRDVLSGRKKYFIHEYPCHAPGEQRWFECRVTPFPGDGPTRVIVAHENVTQRHLAREKLAASEKRFRQAVEHSPMPVMIHAEDGQVISVNRAWSEISGYRHEDIPTIADWTRLAYGEHRGTVEKVIKQLYGMKARKHESILTIRCRNGEQRVWDFSSAPLEPLPDGRRIIKSIAVDITERKQTEEALQREHDFTNAVLNSLPGIFYCIDEKLNFLRWNRNFENVSGYSSEEIARSKPLDYFSGTDRDLIRERIGEVFEKGESDAEADFVTKAGKRIPYYFTGMRTDIGGSICLVGVGIDMTALRQKEEALRINEAQLSNALKIARAGHWEYDVATDRFTFNDHFYAILRTTAERERGYTMSPAEYAKRFVHPNDIEVVTREVKAALEATDPHFTRELEHRAIFADGETGYIAVRIFTQKDSTGKTVKTYGVNQDITRRKAAEERLALQDFALNHASEASYLMDRQGRFLDVNREACRALGYTREELLRMSVFDIDPVLTPAAWNRYWKQIRKSGSTTLETTHRRKDAGTFPVEVTANFFEYQGKKYDLALARDITDRKKTEAVLKENEMRFRNVARATSDIIWDWDLETDTVWLSEDMQTRFGYQYDELEAGSAAWTRRIHPDDRERVIDRINKVIYGKEENWSDEYRFRHRDGSYVHISNNGYVIRDDEGKAVRMAGGMTDISERKAAEEKIMRLNRVYRMLSEINSLIVHVQNRRQLFEEACRIAVEDGGFLLAWVGGVDSETGQVTPLAYSGNHDYLENVHITMDPDKPGGRGPTAIALRNAKPSICNDIESDPSMAPWRQRALARGFGSCAAVPLSEAGKVIGTINLYSGETGFFDEEEVKLLDELASDISYACQNISRKEELEYVSSFDQLTGLANHKLLNEHLDSVLGRASKNNRKVALLVCDLKKFRHINNLYGHDVGDRIIQEVANRFKQQTSDPVNIGRLTNDYFAMILHDVRDSTGIAYMFENTLFPTMNAPFRIDDLEIQVGFRGGIAVYPTDGSDAEALYRSAEAALKRAKYSGEEYVFYQPEMTSRIAETLKLENKLRSALDKDQFVLHYQPKINTVTRKICGLEALIRWNDPETGLVPPGDFIPILEETGLILDVGLWALRRATSDYRRWASELTEVPTIAVNVSAAQLQQADFSRQILGAVEHDGATTPVDLEITESMVMVNMEQNIEKLGVLRQAGIGIDIDDFGTGYSSLSYIASLPIDALKIDRSFITNMTTQPQSLTIVTSIISLAHSLNLKVVAEGVENEEQAKYLRLLNCDEMQGFLFSKPLPAEKIITLLQTGVIK